MGIADLSASPKMLLEEGSSFAYCFLRGTEKWLLRVPLSSVTASKGGQRILISTSLSQHLDGGPQKMIFLDSISYKGNIPVGAFSSTTQVSPSPTRNLY